VTKDGYLEGQLLLAMPGMADPRFDRALIYLCSHSEEGAMGLVINQAADNINFEQLMEQLEIDLPHPHPTLDIPIHAGGPVELGRGFVLHSADWAQESTLVISETLALTATIDILKAIARGAGPVNYLLALGYAGWGAGQLEEELQQNSWLNAEADEELIFRTELDMKWPRAMTKLGIDLSMLSSLSGHA